MRGLWWLVLSVMYHSHMHHSLLTSSTAAAGPTDLWLPNPDVQCFFNAALQMLLASVSLCWWFTNGPGAAIAADTGAHAAVLPLVAAFVRAACARDDATARTARDALFERVRQESAAAGGCLCDGEQDDSHEPLLFLLRSLKEEVGCGL